MLPNCAQSALNWEKAEVLEKGETSRNGDGMRDRYSTTAKLCENLCRISALVVVSV